MKKGLLILPFIASLSFAQSDTVWHNITRANRRANSQIIRKIVAQYDAQQLLAAQATSGDEQLYADKRGSFGKSLKQLDSGLIDPNAFEQLVFAVQTTNPANFNSITMGTSPIERKLVNPQAAYTYNLDGADGWINTMPAAPALASAETAGEMVEVYWHALTRDVPFNEYSSNSLTLAAVADLNKLSNFKGPKSGGSVTTGTLFRGNTTGDLNGPFISQFLYLPVPYGPATNWDGTNGTLATAYQAQVVPLSTTDNDFMINFTDWHAVQKGENPTDTIDFTLTRTFIRNERDLGDYVHQDTPCQPYLNAANILLAFGSDALDAANPYIDNPTQESFVNYGTADILDLVTKASAVALRTAWYQKWVVHRRCRPEFVGFLANQQKAGTTDFGLSSELINSDALTQTFATFGSYFLPIAYPEGSPTHPSYPAGHATVAGACTTILKAYFNEDYAIPNPVEPDSSNEELVAYSDSTLTVGGELNKLAANISLGRDMAGVHYRSDGTEGILLGEKVAIALLEDQAFTRNIPFNGFSLTKFDGTKVTIGAKKTTNLVG